MVGHPRIEELRRRVEKDPSSIAFAQLGEEYRRAGSFGEAIETCRAGLARHPGYLSARVTLGRSLIETGELDDAEAALTKVLESAVENLAAIRGLADISHRRGDLRQALEFYRRALGLAQNDPDLEQMVIDLGREVGDDSAAADVPEGLSFAQARDELMSFAPPEPEPEPESESESELEIEPGPEPAEGVADLEPEEAAPAEIAAEGAETAGAVDDVPGADAVQAIDEMLVLETDDARESLETLETVDALESPEVPDSFDAVDEEVADILAALTPQAEVAGDPADLDRLEDADAGDESTDSVDEDALPDVIESLLVVASEEHAESSDAGGILDFAGVLDREESLSAAEAEAGEQAAPEPDPQEPAPADPETAEMPTLESFLDAIAARRDPSGS